LTKSPLREWQLNTQEYPLKYNLIGAMLSIMKKFEFSFNIAGPMIYKITGEVLISLPKINYTNQGFIKF
jgi:hypothetical protein